MTSDASSRIAHSVSPSGESFLLPAPEEYAAEFNRLKTLVAAHRQAGREIVVVMGVGFVGAVMAGIVADAVKKGGLASEAAAPKKNAKIQVLTPWFHDLHNMKI